MSNIDRVLRLFLYCIFCNFGKPNDQNQIKMSAAIKIALVDDEVLFRKGISFLLQREDNIEIIFEASNGEELTF